MKTFALTSATALSVILGALAAQAQTATNTQPVVTQNATGTAATNPLLKRVKGAESGENESGDHEGGEGHDGGGEGGGDD